jgi:hypothetical protein
MQVAEIIIAAVAALDLPCVRKNLLAKLGQLFLRFALRFRVLVTGWF